MENFYRRKSFMRGTKIAGIIPTHDELESALFAFSKKEWFSFLFLGMILFISMLGIVNNVNQTFLVSVPMQGGSITEGIIGTPRFINPVLALSDADRDLVSLVYSGLMRKDPDGNLIPDLAASVEASEDGLNYTFTLKDNIYFHDEVPVTADDVVFTISALKDPVIKSPRKGNWDGVSVSKVDERTVKFTLKQSYASFLDNMTIGIMPAHIWSDSPIELHDANTNPIGTGAYKVEHVNRETSGTIISYELQAFDNFVLEKPYIDSITLYFYPNETSLISALANGTVSQISSITPEDASILKEENYTIESSVLPRVFGLFFNQSQNQIFTNKSVVEAINLAIDKDAIVQEVLKGYGVVINDPIPPNIIARQQLNATSQPTREQRLAQAVNILGKDGWKKGASGFLEKTTTVKNKKTTAFIEFSISTGSSPDLATSAELIQKDLQALGMKVDVKTFDVGNLNQSVIRPRKYDALLFGQIINHESDLLAFWHSSQRKDPGLNVAMYTSAKVDTILEDAFVTVDEQARIKKYAQFEEEIKRDMPAVFLYSPNFIYVVSNDLKGLAIDRITSPADRFLNAYSWYTETDKVWTVFAD